jgi:threonine/homoserine/homoserine lactone efflux protein
LLSFITQGLVLGGTAAAQPGPLQAYLLSQTLKNGWRRTIPAAFAPLISDGPIVLLTVLVLTRTPDWSLVVLQIAGGLFLLYLALGAYKSYKSAVTITPQILDSSDQSLYKAALMNFLSPNPYIFWTTIAGPIFIAGWRQAPIYGVSFVFGFYLTLVGGFMAFVALFGLTKTLDVGVNRALSGLSALALFLFALYQLWHGLSRL